MKKLTSLALSLTLLFSTIQSSQAFLGAEQFFKTGFVVGQKSGYGDETIFYLKTENGEVYRLFSKALSQKITNYYFSGEKVEIKGQDYFDDYSGEYYGIKVSQIWNYQEKPEEFLTTVKQEVETKKETSDYEKHLIYSYLGSGATLADYNKAVRFFLNTEVRKIYKEMKKRKLEQTLDQELLSLLETLLKDPELDKSSEAFCSLKKGELELNTLEDYLKQEIQNLDEAGLEKALSSTGEDLVSLELKKGENIKNFLNKTLSGTGADSDLAKELSEITKFEGENRYTFLLKNKNLVQKLVKLEKLSPTLQQAKLESVKNSSPCEIVADKDLVESLSWEFDKKDFFSESFLKETKERNFAGFSLGVPRNFEIAKFENKEKKLAKIYFKDFYLSDLSLKLELLKEVNKECKNKTTLKISGVNGERNDCENFVSYLLPAGDHTLQISYNKKSEEFNKIFERILQSLKLSGF